MERTELTAERLRAVLSYDADSGQLRCVVRRGNAMAGSLVGCITPKGYSVVMIDRVLYMAHRLCWLYVHGAWPDGDIDHINGVRNDNRLSNLRAVSRQVNMQNQRRARSNNKSGLLGVNKRTSGARRKPWTAQININGRRVYIGDFETPERAHAAYIEAKRAHHEGNTL